MRVILVFFIIWCSFGVVAGKIHDPTQPKANLSEVKMNKTIPSDKNSEISTKEKLITTVDIPQEVIVVQSIMRGKKGNKAIISGTLVEAGDKVKGVLISQINSDHVVVIRSGKRERLYIYE